MLLALMGLLFVAAIVGMTRPLWRADVSAGQRRRAANVVAYRQRLAEVEADTAAGLMDGDTAAGLRAELDARLLLDTDVAETPVATATKRNLALTVVLGVLVLGVAVAGYFFDGSWKIDQQIASAPIADDGGPVPPGSVDEMVSRLAERLEKDPGDPQGWALLGRSYFVMQRYDAAAAAYARANELTGHREPDLLVNEGESLGLSLDRDLRGRPQQLFEAALAIAPTNGKALWYAGMAAAQDGNSDAAKAHWSELSKQDLPPELRTVLDERLVELGVTPAPVAAAGPVPSAPSAAGSEAAPTSGDALFVRVGIAPELADRIPSDATLFVFAKAQEGPPMPLAVSRGSVGQLPREIRLDDSMAMTPAAKLTQFDRWIVTARISRAGQAMAVSGDLQGSLTAARGDLGKSALVLTIDTVVP